MPRMRFSPQEELKKAMLLEGIALLNWASGLGYEELVDCYGQARSNFSGAMGQCASVKHWEGLTDFLRDQVSFKLSKLMEENRRLKTQVALLRSVEDGFGAFREAVLTTSAEMEGVIHGG